MVFLSGPEGWRITPSLRRIGKESTPETSYFMNESARQQFLEAYDRCGNALFAFCYAFLGDRERARDAVQEAFMRTWRHLAGGNRVAELRPFLYRTARNFMIDGSRKPTTASLEEFRDTGADVPDVTSADPATAAEASRAIRLAQELPPKEREAVLLRYVDGMMPRDIAAVTGDGENAISVRIHRGMERLRGLMGTDT